MSCTIYLFPSFIFFIILLHTSVLNTSIYHKSNIPNTIFQSNPVYSHFLPPRMGQHLLHRQPCRRVGVGHTTDEFHDRGAKLLRPFCEAQRRIFSHDIVCCRRCLLQCLAPIFIMQHLKQSWGGRPKVTKCRVRISCAGETLFFSNSSRSCSKR